MINLPFSIPVEALYAGLAGTVLALLVATWQQNWRCSVFFLLALRLAIGWHFLFEGLYKVNTVYSGPNDSTKVFTSEPYFKVAPGVLGPTMRKQFEDTSAIITDRVKASKDIKQVAFAKLAEEQQAAECPAAVAKSFDAIEDKTEDAIKNAALKSIDDAGKAAKALLEAAKTDDEKKAIADDTQKIRDAQQKKIDNAKSLAKAAIQAAKAAYARWVYGVDTREMAIASIGGKDKPQFTAPERLEWVTNLQREVADVDARAHDGLGNGYGYEKKRANALRLDVVAAEATLAKDAYDFSNELRSALTGGKAEAETPSKGMGPLGDKITMWFLVGVGSALLAGFLARLAAALGAGFLIVTYLLHPAFPWFEAPPGTEGNPLFINKNIIECLALLSLACMPTGRWMGLDALFLGVPRDPSGSQPVAAPVPPRSLQSPKRG